MDTAQEIVIPRRSTRFLDSMARLALALAVPVLLVMGSVRLVMTPLYLQLEYGRPGFPSDIYGFPDEERLELAEYALNYLINNEEIDYLGDLTFPNGAPLYTASELRHMEDVQVVTQLAFLLMIGVGIETAVVAFLLWRTPRGRAVLREGLFAGAALTLGIIVFIVLFAVVAWDMFFTAFHQVFFEAGTWQFRNDDTLIRLFPEQFWFDAALVIGAITVLGALIILFVCRPRIVPS